MYGVAKLYVIQELLILRTINVTQLNQSGTMVRFYN